VELLELLMKFERVVLDNDYCIYEEISLGCCYTS
jgi:hypothetical protein